MSENQGDFVRTTIKIYRDTHPLLYSIAQGLSGSPRKRSDRILALAQQGLGLELISSPPAGRPIGVEPDRGGDKGLNVEAPIAATTAEASSSLVDEFDIDG